MNTEGLKFGLIGSEQLYNDGIGKVSLWNGWIANHSHDTRAEVVANIATLSYGFEFAKQPRKLYKQLVRQGHLSCLEFVREAFEGTGLEDSLRNSNFPTFTEEGGAFDEECSVGDWESHNKNSFALFKVKAPIFVIRQFMRHRQASYLELSRRYTKPNKVVFEFFDPDGLPETKEHQERSVKLYHKRIANGMKPELARGCIPVESYSEFWCSVDYLSLGNFLHFRASTHAQKEIRDLAQAMYELAKTHQPEFAKRVESAREQAKETVESQFERVIPESWLED